MRSQAARGLGLLTVGVLAGAFLLFSAPALADEGLGITATFGSSTSGTPDPQPLSGPTGVAVNQTSGDVYVVDRGNDSRRALQLER